MKKNIFTKGIKFISDSDYRFDIMSGMGVFDKMDDREYLERLFKAIMKKPLNLSKPQTFNEKLQWLKLYDRRPEYTMMVDKYKVRDYIANQLGEEYLIPLLGVWNNPDDIDFNTLPNQFVLKCNHNSGLGMCICKDKSKLNINKVRNELRKGLNQDYYLACREWPYKDVPRKIIAEKYMTNSEKPELLDSKVHNLCGNYSEELTDYKFFCFDGYVDCVMVCTERQTGNPKFYFFDENWELLRLNISGKKAPEKFTLPKPNCIDEMFLIAKKLSTGMPFTRVDLYSCNGNIYFGEITFFPDSGFDANLLPETDLRFGKLIDLK